MCSAPPNAGPGCDGSYILTALDSFNIGIAGITPQLNPIRPYWFNNRYIQQTFTRQVWSRVPSNQLVESSYYYFNMHFFSEKLTISLSGIIFIKRHKF